MTSTIDPSSPGPSTGRPLYATTCDVDWIDRYGTALVCGHAFSAADITAAEQPGDRDALGTLTTDAKQRIARLWTVDIQQRQAQAYAAWRATHR